MLFDITNSCRLPGFAGVFLLLFTKSWIVTKDAIFALCYGSSELRLGLS